ncbi:protease inhibitor I9 family protein [Bradyrhizobium elkanii]|uniref:protease inhibitor I9 family protein n=1 Tax=Bradyrhizobium elkanii TaxID=29448 RepID=UPI00209C74C7|nr:protease inhibitor I9 family protein [Bradyrhizobium elkanii]MCP1926358.1 hypothetical protein [Bradyrhizobium elkanii]
MALRTLAFCTIALAMPVLASVAYEVTMKIDEALSRKLEDSPGGEPLGVVITLERPEDLAPLMSKGIKPDLVYQNIPAFSAILPPDQIREISRLPQVKSIELDSKAHTLTRP